MNITEMIKKYGVFIAEDAIEEIHKLDRNEVRRLAELLEREKPVFIDSSILKRIKNPEIRIVEFLPEKREMSMDEFIEVLNTYYDFFKGLIEKRMNPLRLVSILNLRKNEYYGVIGMVRTLREEEQGLYIEIEDKTSSCTVFIEKRTAGEIGTIFPDEVIGVEGLFDGKKINAEKVIFPDISEIKRIDIKKECRIYARNDSESMRIGINGRMFKIERPSMIKIDSVNILVFINRKNLNPELYLRKRTLTPGKINLFALLREEPHAVITTGIPGKRESYKGVKIFVLEPSEEIKIKLPEFSEII